MQALEQPTSTTRWEMGQAAQGKGQGNRKGLPFYQPASLSLTLFFLSLPFFANPVLAQVPGAQEQAAPDEDHAVPDSHAQAAAQGAAEAGDYAIKVCFCVKGCLCDVSVQFVRAQARVLSCGSSP